MSSREALPASVLLALLLAPAALAHGAEPADAGAFDPLSLSLHAFATTDNTLVASPPEKGAVALPPTPGLGDGVPLAFALEVPVRFVAGQGVEVALELRAEKAVVARDANGDALELSIARNGEPIADSARRVPLSEPVLAPGSAASVRAVLQVPGVTFAKGDTLAVLVRPLMPGLPSDALFVLVGGERPSIVDVHDMRVPSVADLELQETSLPQFLLGTEDFVPPAGASAFAVRVGHARIEADPVAPGASVAGGYVVVRGEEAGEDARAHAAPDRPGRLAAAHELRVGSVLVRAHPGVGVAVPIPAGASSVRVVCVRNCPDGGFSLTLGSAATSPSPSSSEPASVLVPPPRSTAGIPVSQDAPPEKERLLPQPAVLPLAGLLVGALWWGARRTSAKR